MVHDLTYTIMGFAYLTMFLEAFRHIESARLLDRLALTPVEHYCHLALGILYPLSVAHVV